MHHRKFKFAGYVVLVLFIGLFHYVSASYAATSSSINDIEIQKSASGDLTLILKGVGSIDLGKANFVQNPSRIFYDIDNAILKHNAGRTQKIPVKSGNIDAIAISQFNTNPNIVRIVLHFSQNPDESSLRKSLTTSSKGSESIIKFTRNPNASPVVEIPKPVSKTNTQPVPKTAPQTKPEISKISHIDKILFQNNQANGDVLIFQSVENITEPQIRTTESGVSLVFPNSVFKMPSGFKDEVDIPVNSAFLENVNVRNNPSDAVVDLKYAVHDNSKLIEYQIAVTDENTIELRVIPARIADSAPLPHNFPQKSMQDSPSGEMRDLFDSKTQAIPIENIPGNQIKSSIRKIQYMPLSIGERFIITTSGDFKPELENMKYPSRLRMSSRDTTVILPKEAEDKYQVKIDGAISKLMKVYQKKSDAGYESLILFYYSNLEGEDILYNFYPSPKGAGIYHLDIVPVAVENFKPQSDNYMIAEAESMEFEEEEEIPFTAEKNASEHVNVEKSAEPVAVAVESKIESSPSSENNVVSIPVVKEESSRPVAIQVPVLNEPKRPEPAIQPPVEKQTQTAQTPMTPAIEPSSLPEQTAPVQFNPIEFSFVKSDGYDEFRFASDDPICQYEYSILNNPTRLFIKFPERDVVFDSEYINWNHLDGNVSELVWIPGKDELRSVSGLYIYLKYNWEKVECSLSHTDEKDFNLCDPRLPFAIILKRID